MSKRHKICRTRRDREREYMYRRHNGDKKEERGALQAAGCTSQDQRNSIILSAGREVTAAAVCRDGTVTVAIRAPSV